MAALIIQFNPGKIIRVGKNYSLQNGIDLMAIFEKKERMYTKKKPEDLNCGIEVAIKVFISKWKPCLLNCIHNGKRRPSEIHRALPNATPRVLNMQLKELEQYQVITKKIYPGLPPKVEYYLTDLGKTIIPIVDQLDEWGNKNNEQIKKITEMQKVLSKIKV